MDYRNLNLLNERTNLLSGNVNPLTPDGSEFSTGSLLFGILTWLGQATQICVLIPGVMVVSHEKALTDGTVTAVLSIEIWFNSLRLFANRKKICELIRQMNELLRNGDDTMKTIVTSTVDPLKKPLAFYWIGGGLSVVVWAVLPFPLVWQQSTFYYEDFRMPAVFSKEPFGTEVFLIGMLIIIFANTYVFLKKGALDIYMIHLLLVITAQYRYTATKLNAIFRNANMKDNLEQVSPEVDQWIDKELKALCRHHTAVLKISSLLKDVLSMSFSMIYLNSVLRFCFIAIMLSTVPSTSFLEGAPIVLYTCGNIISFYILCNCVQQLQDASLGMTDEAFHEHWYRFGASVKRTYMLLILGCRRGCRISTNEKFNLSLNSFMSILNQSYSIAILLL